MLNKTDDLKITVLTNIDGELKESDEQKCEWFIVKLEPKSI